MTDCVLCGRQSGAVVCSRCRLELAPTRLGLWAECLGFSIDELAELAGVSRSTAKRALAGEPIGKRSAAHLARVTRIPAVHLQAGEPSPFARRS